MENKHEYENIHNLEVQAKLYIQSFLANEDKLEQDISITWEQLITCENSEAMKSIQKIFDELNNALVNIEYLNKHYNFNIDIGIIIPIFNNMEKAINDEHYVYLADLIEYEVKTILRDWKRKIEKQSKNWR